MTKKTGFDAYDIAVEIAREVRPIVEKVKRFDKDLAEQTRSACQSIGLNVAEGDRRTGGDRTHLFKIALGSAGETLAALHQAEAWGYVREEETTKALELLDREKAMLWSNAPEGRNGWTRTVWLTVDSRPKGKAIQATSLGDPVERSDG